MFVLITSPFSCFPCEEWTQENHIYFDSQARVGIAVQLLNCLLWASLAVSVISGYTNAGFMQQPSWIVLLMFLIPRATETNQRLKSGDTPLMIAAGRGNFKTVERLLEAGENPALRNGKRRTAEQLAQAAGYPEIARLLSVATPVMPT